MIIGGIEVPIDCEEAAALACLVLAAPLLLAHQGKLGRWLSGC